MQTESGQLLVFEQVHALDEGHNQVVGEVVIVLHHSERIVHPCICVFIKYDILFWVVHWGILIVELFDLLIACTIYDVDYGP